MRADDHHQMESELALHAYNDPSLDGNALDKGSPVVDEASLVDDREWLAEFHLPYQEYGLSSKALMSANNLKSTGLAIGQKLKIPSAGTH